LEGATPNRITKKQSTSGCFLLKVKATAGITSGGF
jgi:hypothetical protein